MSRPLRRLGLCSFFGAPLFIGSDALYTYLISVSRAFCESSQYINRNKSNCREGKLRRAASRFAKPRSFIARAACFLGRGRRPDAPGNAAKRLARYRHLCERNRGLQNLISSRKGTVLFFSLLRKEPKVAQRVATLWTPRDGSKLYRLCFFVTFPVFVPKPICGATRFFGCFEPVRKGCCSADARPLFFENRKPHYKLTGASHIRKGWLLVIFVAVGICFCGMRIKSFELNKFLQFCICQKQWRVN